MRSQRFGKNMADAMQRLNASIGFDRRLYSEDIEGSIAWAAALRDRGILTEAEEEQVCNGLASVRDEIESGSFEFSEALEDIHMNIEARLTNLVGEPGAKLHTGRSRNDQVATDFRLYTKRQASSAAAAMSGLVRAFVDAAEREIDVVIPAYTHLQRAQPVLFSHHLLAYAEMFWRDRERFVWAAEQADACPLGSGACAGNQFGVDREDLSRRLGFTRLTRNSMDAVSDRDFACDFLHAATLFLTHLSRFSEDAILWSSAEFGFVVLDDSVTTGSSMLPQKKNADACELARGKCGRVLGRAVGLLTTLKGLPMTYNKDLQEDKEAVFDAVDTVADLLPVMTVLLDTLQVNRERAAAALEGGYLEALAVADYLTRKDIPFRTAHDVAGAAVRAAESAGGSLGALSLEAYQRLHAAFGEDLFEAISIDGCLADKDVVGGTAPRRVREEIKRWRDVLAAPEPKSGDR